MTALHRMKAYFGMVPVDDLDAYDGYDAYDGDRRDVDDRRRPFHDDHDSRDAREPRYAHAGGRPERADRADRVEHRVEHRAERYDPAEFRSRAPRPRDPASLPDAETVGRGGSRGRSWEANTGPNHTPVRGLSGSGSRSSASLASVGGASGAASPASSASSVSSASSASSTSASAAPTGSSVGSASPSGVGGSAAGTAAPTRGALAVDESHRRESTPVEEPVAPVTTTPAPAEIVTLRPTSYNEARVIGERYRDGIPVIINLTELDDVAAKRLVDFAAGLAFALRGSIEKVTNRVFLLSPPNVEVSAADRKKLAENTLSAPS